MGKRIVYLCAQKIVNGGKPNGFPAIEHGKVLCVGIAIADEDVENDPAEEVDLTRRA